MNIDDKLEYFMDVSIQTAGMQHKEIVNQYKAKLDRIFEDHKKESLRKAALAQKVAIDSIQRAAHKDFSHEQVTIRRKFSVELDKLKDELFNEVMMLLEEYKKTPAYYDLLLKQIIDAKNFAKDEAITIYIDPADSQYADQLSLESNMKLTISSYSFMGGTRSVIPSKNILINNSFETKLTEAREHFNIEHIRRMPYGKNR